MKTKVNGLVLSATAIWSLSSGAAFAAGYAIQNQSTSASGTALSSETVNGRDPSGMFANPANIAVFERPTFSVGVNYTKSNVDFENGSSQSVSGLPYQGRAESEVDDVSDAATIPSIYFVDKLGDKMNFGFLVNAPWGTQSDYGEDWVGRYHATSTKIRSLNFQALVSYKLDEKFSFGGGPVIQYLEGRLQSHLDTGSLALRLSPSNQASLAGFMGTYDTNADFDGSGYGYGLAVGMRFKPTSDVIMGLSYRSAVKHNLKGDVVFGKPDLSTEASLAASQAKALGAFTNSDAETSVTTPEVIRFGTDFKVMDRMHTYINISYTRWSVFDKLVLESSGLPGEKSTTRQNWKDSTFVSLGMDYELGDETVLRGGIGFEQGVVADEDRTPRTPDNDRTIVSLGLGYAVNEHSDIDASFTHYSVKDAAVKQDASAYQDNQSRGDLEGTYKISANVFMLGYSYKI